MRELQKRERVRNHSSFFWLSLIKQKKARKLSDSDINFRTKIQEVGVQFLLNSKYKGKRGLTIGFVLVILVNEILILILSD